MSKVYYYIYGFSNGKHWVQAAKYDSDFREVIGRTYQLTQEELDSRNWIRKEDDVKMLEAAKKDIPEKEEEEEESPYVNDL